MEDVQKLVCVCCERCRSFAPWSEFPRLPRWDGTKGAWRRTLHQRSPLAIECSPALLGHTYHGNAKAEKEKPQGCWQGAGQEVGSRSTAESWHAGRAGGQEGRARQRLGLGSREPRQLIQRGCGGERRHPARESGRTGARGCGRRKEGKFPVRGGKVVSCESRRGLDRMSQERVQTKLPPTEKVREHENLALIRWGVGLHTQIRVTSVKL